MNNRSAGPRSFNTVERSNREPRLRRLQQCRILLLAICSLILLLALTGLVFLFCQIGHSVATANPGGGKSGKVVYGDFTTNATNPDALVNLYTGDLILVNTAHAYRFPSTRLEDLSDGEKQAYNLLEYRVRVNEELPYVIRTAGERNFMNPKAAEAMNRFLTAYYTRTGEQLTFYEGYRSYQYQEELKSQQVPAGCSDQHTGLSGAISNSAQSVKLTAEQLTELTRICAQYGFIQRYPTDKSGETGISGYTELFRYVGVPHALYITRQNLSLEGYIKLLQTTYTYSGNHLLLDADGGVVTKDAAYEIYYVPVSGDSATVPVPKNYKYSISGDNVGGFIVTVDLNSPVA